MAVMTYATSSWNVPYTAAAVCFHIFAISQLWSPKTSTDGRRWVMVAIGVFIYSTPLLMHITTMGGLMLMGPMALGGLISQCENGPGHALFHVLVWAHTAVLAYILSHNN